MSVKLYGSELLVQKFTVQELAEIGGIVGDLARDLAAAQARVEVLEDALRPFAEGGVKWLKLDEHDDSSYASAPDRAPIVRLGAGNPLRVGMLRKAALAMPPEGQELPAQDTKSSR